MSNRFNKLILELGSHSIDQYPNEACGIINKQFEYIPCRNISKKPKTSFILDPIDYIKLRAEIWGIFHSHPGADIPVPSNRDINSLISTYKYIVGFGKHFYIYDTSFIEVFNESHLTL